MRGQLDRGTALGILSLIIWALLITISIKYCLFVMRADNHGEGGILALMSLITPRETGRISALVGMGLFGAALIYGDGIITPAISVLSALEPTQSGERSKKHAQASPPEAMGDPTGGQRRLRSQHGGCAGGLPAAA
jgi:K+ transporter